MDNVKILEVKQSIFASNDEQAAQLRQSLKEKKIFLLNLMSAPGSGKTTNMGSAAFKMFCAMPPCSKSICRMGNGSSFPFSQYQFQV